MTDLAIRYTKDAELLAFTGHANVVFNSFRQPVIYHDDARHTVVEVGDWVFRYQGRLYACSDVLWPVISELIENDEIAARAIEDLNDQVMRAWSEVRHRDKQLETAREDEREKIREEFLAQTAKVIEEGEPSTCSQIQLRKGWAMVIFARDARLVREAETAELRLLREQRTKVLALADEHAICCEWLATDIQTVYAAADQPCPSGCPHPYRSHGPDGCRVRVGHCDVCACQEPGSTQPAPAEGGN